MQSAGPQTQQIAVRVTGDRHHAFRCVEHIGGDVDAFDYTVDYATGAALVVARDFAGVRLLERLVESGLAVPVRDLPRRITSRTMPPVPRPGSKGEH